MKVAEAIARTLAGHGVETFFGLVGSGNFSVVNALRATGAEFYSSRHERASGKVGVASVHQGPGFTNMLTGPTEAARAAPRWSCSPLTRRPTRSGPTSR